MSISELTSARKVEWNTFVRENNDGTFFHLAEWKDVIERGFGCKTHYLISEENGTINGVLPLALVRRPLFGPALISTPLCVYGGALGKAEELESAARKKAQELGVQYLELRGGQGSTSEDTMFYTFRRTLSNDHEENLKAIPRKQRAEVRKGIAANLDTTVNQDIDIFYKIYSSSVRGLGTPVFPKRYLKILMEVFGGDCHITTISHNSQPLSSVLSFQYKDQILPYYGGGLSAARKHSAYPYMYWKVMEAAVDNGLRLFDFGRSMKGSGAFAFKKNFGFEPEPLSYQHHLVKATEVPNMNPDNPRNKMLTSCWKKLPLPVANALGPHLYKIIM